MTIIWMKSSADKPVGDIAAPPANATLSEQEKLYIEFVMALDAKLLPTCSSQRKTATHFSKKKL